MHFLAAAATNRNQQPKEEVLITLENYGLRKKNNYKAAIHAYTPLTRKAAPAHKMTTRSAARADRKKKVS